MRQFALHQISLAFAQIGAGFKDAITLWQAIEFGQRAQQVAREAPAAGADGDGAAASPAAADAAAAASGAAAAACASAPSPAAATPFGGMAAAPAAGGARAAASCAASRAASRAASAMVLGGALCGEDEEASREHEDAPKTLREESEGAS